MCARARALSFVSLARSRRPRGHERQPSIVIRVATTWKNVSSHLISSRRCPHFRLTTRCTKRHVTNQRSQSLIARLSRVVFRTIVRCTLSPWLSRIAVPGITWTWTKKKSGGRYANLGRKISLTSFFFYVASVMHKCTRSCVQREKVRGRGREVFRNYRH